MSNAIRYDPLLVRHLADELDARLAGRACAAVPLFAPDRSVTLPLAGGEALRFDLHPARGWIQLVAHEAALPEDAAAFCTRVHAPLDERLLVVDIEGSHRFRGGARRLIVELHTNQWNALLVGVEDGRVVTVLRGRDAGGRALRPGAVYQPPPGVPRYGAGAVAREAAWAEWQGALGAAAPVERARVLISRFAWTGSFSAPALLGRAAQEGAGTAALAEAFERWWSIRPPAPATPVLLHTGRGLQPYPVVLPGLTTEPARSLLDAMARAAVAEAAAAPVSTAPDEARLLERALAHTARLERRVERLRARLAEGAEAERMRHNGDLLLAHLWRVPRGAASVRLPAWEEGGAEVEVALDPALSPAENAAAWYDRARRLGRAIERLPALLEAAEREAARWAAAARDAGAGAPLAPWVVRTLTERRLPESARSEAATALPYRVYRTSGGLEVRVGRSARDNDRLTFHHTAPNDVWLHAQSVPGSHVVLRWRDAEGAPPARDLAEAAALAALFSRARTSSLVPVDWTRRKHVRKPRGAPAGAVLPQRVRTLFVEPDAALEERLRVGSSDAPPE